MPDRTVYKQTAKGQREAGARSSTLPSGLGKLLGLVDGKTTVDNLRTKAGGVDEAKLQAALERLKKDGYIEAQASASAAAPAQPQEPITLDFTMHALPSQRAAPPPQKPEPKPASPPPPKPEAKPAPKPAAPHPAPQKPANESELDLSGAIDAPAPKPSAAQVAEAEQMTLAGMRTLKAAGYYVNILSKPGMQHPPRAGSKYSVLILEHEKQNALLVARALVLAEFDVRNAETREQALTEMKKVPLPDAIVLNPQVPDLNGMDLLARLQQHQYYASVPVIVITDDHAHETVVDALARGAAGYMTKPFKQEALLDTVRAVLGLN